MILCVAATATQLEMLSPLILGLHVMWKTPWTRSTSSSDDRGFTCQSVFIILPRFVLYSSRFNLRYVKYFPIAACFFFFFSLPLSLVLWTPKKKREYADRIRSCSVWITSTRNARWRYVVVFAAHPSSKPARIQGKSNYRKWIRTCSKKAESVW